LEIVKASTAGFCFGVNKAVNKIYELLEKNDGTIYTIGPVIHNEQMVEYLRQKGVKDIDNVKEAGGEGYIVIRAHGVQPSVYEEINKNEHTVIDATCPYVKKIHNLVSKEYDKGNSIIIIGDRNHPEVIGIKGWCGDKGFVVYSREDIDMLPDMENNICVVAQTTITKQKWDEMNEYLKNRYKDIKKYDTICSATGERQKEASEIATGVDLMVVVGSKNSSNTQKLYEICKNCCDKTYFVETPGELPPVNIKKIKKIGITAGASAPEWLIKEVIERMEELNKNETEMDFKEAVNDSLVVLRSGEVGRGKIIGFNSTEVFVDMGYKSDGIIPMEEFNEDPGFNPQKDIIVGEEIDVFIKRVNDGEGNVLLSKKTVDDIKNWDKVEQAYKDKETIEVKVKKTVSGGLIARYLGIEIFIPGSHVGERFVKDLSGYEGKQLNIRIIDLDRKKRRLVGSEKIIIEKDRKDKEKLVWDEIEEGKIYKGTVKSIADFGAFVDIGGVDGLVHISELSWIKVKHPSDVLSVGDAVEVTVLEFDREKKRISLGYRKQEDNPWYNAGEKYKVGDVVKGKVVRLVPFGVFVELEKGIDGLVHISQISSRRIVKPGDVLAIGQTVEAKITDVDLEKNKIGLSIKEVAPIDPDYPEEKEGKVNEKEKEKEKSIKKEEDIIPNEHREDMTIRIGDLVNGDD
jgi:ribosomal protein S1/(E)-4-hydroxy-3-methyl-but-2-enyl pyrophosphate reductase